MIVTVYFLTGRTCRACGASLRLLECSATLRERSVIIEKMTPRWMRFVLNLYPPYLGANIRVERISPDWAEIDVSMRLRWFNQNAVGTHFGGSLYAMVDPHLMLMHLKILGRGYIVWDKSAAITFVQPGKGRVRAMFRVTEEDIAEIEAKAEKHTKVAPVYHIDVRDDNDEVVAQVTKELYVRKKRLRQCDPEK